MAKKNKFSEAILRLLSHKSALPILELKESAIEQLEASDSTENGSGESFKAEKPEKLKYAVSRALSNLEEGGLVESIFSGRQSYVRLTKEGKQKLLSLKLDNSTTPIPASWDGYWRIILLDLPESRKQERESLRYLLKKAGFIMLKNSAWISPYPFEHLFANLKKDLGLGGEMMIIKTESLDEETEKSLMEMHNIPTK
jgi:DNA-binding transcriptional ArsR family regulator